ncbi:F0F1 ATP synthase subunit B [Janthinobacterium sp. UMAB-56]|uniref:F0F1 ATP synthase subunit B family protein n=1 Tax=Janthinobacterium sp. UMAB-56 TaxID=1365361 RepID=UPI001C598B58|nr:F0F1 ATP synthase subunit B [Janthinobacterium sp. UMAB-56]
MLIDWFTVAAQMLNFLILAWLLKRFLYRPVLDAIDAREKATAATVADANARQAQVQSEQADLASKQRDFDQQRAAMLAQAKQQAKAEGERLLELARTRADTQRANYQSTLETDYQQLGADITRRAREQVLLIAGKALADLAGATLEQTMCDMFMRRLIALDGTSKTSMADAIKAAGGKAQCSSSAPLSPQQQQALAAALDDLCADKTTLTFSTDAQLICGIALTAHGYKLAWNIDDYLATLGDSIGAAVHARAQASAPAPVPADADVAADADAGAATPAPAPEAP